MQVRRRFCGVSPISSIRDETLLDRFLNGYRERNTIV